MTGLDAYSAVTEYHRQHGDDYGSETSRAAKYKTIVDLIHPTSGKTLLDVGCGERAFRYWVSTVDYKGIDLLNGESALDYHQKHDIVVASGIFYKLPSKSHIWELIGHMWDITKEVLAFNSLSEWAKQDPRELAMNPVSTIEVCKQLFTTKLVLRHDYLPHDFTVAMYR